MILTSDQIKELSKIIKDHVDYFTWSIMGEQSVSEEDLQRMKDEGLLPPEVDLDMIQYSFVLGKLESLLTNDEYEDLPFEDLKVEASKYRTRTSYEKNMVSAIRASAGDKIQSLGDKIKNGVLTEVRQQEEKQIIRDVLEQGVKGNRTVVQLSHDLYSVLKDAPIKDFLEVASTEMSDARTKGYIAAVLNEEGKFEGTTDGLDTEVFFHVLPDACPECKKSYLNADGTPRIFKLKDLMANGTNVGVPKKLRTVGSTGDQPVRAVLSPAHPFCYCILQVKPKGFVFDDEGMLVSEESE